MPDPAGLYLHVPFCEGKCAYCDFYSAFADESAIAAYTEALIREMKRWGGSFDRPIDTIYLGGGTPSLLGERIVPLLGAVRDTFPVLPGAEITAELNPSRDPERFLSAARRAGVNRLSVGVQSGNDGELKMLGRRHNAADAERTVALARQAGFDNLSLDLMLGLPESTEQSLSESIDFVLSMRPEHLSAYLLKIEPNTRFGKISDTLVLPDDDAQAAQYLLLCERLRAAGYRHYEISNFCLPGRESRHNLKYWTGGDYLGIGPAAHSLLNGRRFYYPRDLKGFLQSPQTVDDGVGGTAEEEIMLRLRLSDGIETASIKAALPLLLQLERAGLGAFSGDRFALTDRGMLVSNSIITEITEALE